MVHSVASDAVRIGRLDHDVAAQVSHFTAVLPAHLMSLDQRPIQGQ